MAPLIVLAGSLLVVGPSVATVPGPSAWAADIAEAERRFGVPAPWIARVIAAESAGRMTLGGRPIRSPAGAIGLMQLMPRTWADMRAAEHLGDDPDDPHDNILAGTAYLRLMYDRFGYPGLFAAYNAGPARYATALATRGRLPAETLAYLATVAGVSRGVPTRRREAAMQTLFVVRHDGQESARPSRAAPADALFVAGGGLAPGH